MYLSYHCDPDSWNCCYRFFFLWAEKWPPLRTLSNDFGFSIRQRSIDKMVYWLILPFECRRLISALLWFRYRSIRILKSPMSSCPGHYAAPAVLGHPCICEMRENIYMYIKIWIDFPFQIKGCFWDALRGKLSVIQLQTCRNKDLFGLFLKKKLVYPVSDQIFKRHAYSPLNQI